MGNGRLARRLVRPILLLALVPGCQAFPSYRPVVVLARDAETKQPIPNAQLEISYLSASSVHPPCASSGTSGPDGVARLRAAPCEEAGIVLEAAAPGYLAERRDLPDAEIKAIEPTHLFETDERRPVNLVVELYAGPSPTVELVIPEGYRGLVKAEVEVQKDAACPPGQRCFRYAVPPSGEVRVTGPALLERVCGADFRACYAGGAALNPKPEEGEVGFWTLKYEAGLHWFLVGTHSEYDAWRRSARKEEAKESKSSGGGKGGGGGRGRRNRGGGGDQPPSP